MGVCKIRKKWGIDYYFQGRRIREVVGANKKQAKSALDSRRGEIVQGKFSLEKIKPTPYFDDFAEEYLEWAKVNHRSWKRMDESRIKGLKNFFKGKRLGEITPWLIEKFKAQRKDEVQAGTINRDLAVLSSMFSRGIEWGRVIDHPLKGGKVKRLREEGPKERIFSGEEEGRLLSACSGWFSDMVVMALDTGMRLGKLMGLKKEDIDVRGRVVKVRHTKSGRDRRIPLTERVVSIIQKRLEESEHSEFLFQQGKGERPWRVRSAFVRACRKASIQGARFHDLRHTFATRLVTSGIDLATVQRLLGHQDIHMTIRYSHPGSEDTKRAIKMLEKMARSSQQTDTTDKKELQIISVTPQNYW